MINTAGIRWRKQLEYRGAATVNSRHPRPGSGKAVWSRTLARLLAVALFSGTYTLHGQEAGPQVEVVSQDQTVTSPTATQATTSSLLPVLVSLGAQLGYDDNSRTSSNGQGRFFTSEVGTLSYDRTRPGTDIKLITSLGLVERFGQKTDVNAYIDLSLAHQVTPRLTLSGKIDSAYRAEPDFGENVGPNQRVGNYFRSDDSLSAAYQWTRRLSTVSSYSLRLVRYENRDIASFTDREEHTLGEEFRFDLYRATVVVADYRYLLVNYDSFPRDSTTHTALVGVEQAFSPRLNAQLRAGASYRSFQDSQSRTDPDFEGTVNYAINSLSSLSWTTRYGIEEPTVRDALSRTTFRTGLQLRYGFTRRISGVVGIDYHHDDTSQGQTAATSGPAFNTDALQFLLGARYQINRHLDWDLSYEHSEINSSPQFSGYSRNRYSTGLTFTF